MCRQGSGRGGSLVCIFSALSLGDLKKDTFFKKWGELNCCAYEGGGTPVLKVCDQCHDRVSLRTPVLDTSG